MQPYPILWGASRPTKQVLCKGNDPERPGRVLFVFVVLMHHRRQIVHVNVAEHPTAAWTAQQMIEAFPDDTAPPWLVRDRDAIHGDAFQRRVAGMGIGEVLSSPSSPWQNPYAERLIGSIRRECQRPYSEPLSSEAEHRITYPAAQRRFAPITMPWST